MSFTGNKVVSIICSNKEADCYAVFCEDKVLYLSDKNCIQVKKVAYLENIQDFERPIGIYFHHPYICVTERFGLHGAVVNILDNRIYEISREDYHASVSSYSIAFLEKDGETLLLHQTQWNRLDITNLATKQNLTERTILCKVVTEGHKNENDQWIPPTYCEENYLDYFHSLLQASPGFTGFISNGWHWGPVDNIKYIPTEMFLETFENGFIGVDYANGYNWDRPCTFMDEHRFVLAADMEEDEDGNLAKGEDFIYQQLLFYDFSQPKGKYYEPYRKVQIALFKPDKNGEVSGRMYYDEGKAAIVAITNNGAFLLSPEGELLEGYAQVKETDRDVNNIYQGGHYWQYSTIFHQFYKFNEDKGAIEIV